MESKQADVGEIYKRLSAIEEALKSKGILIDDEGELTDEIKMELKKRRNSKNYISHDEVRRRILVKK